MIFETFKKCLSSQQKKRTNNDDVFKRVKLKKNVYKIGNIRYLLL